MSFERITGNRFSQENIIILLVCIYLMGMFVGLHDMALSPKVKACLEVDLDPFGSLPQLAF